MATTMRYFQALDVLAELKAELTELAPDNEQPEDPYLEMVLQDLQPLPKDGLFLGQADDGLPVLLNLFDSAPGPLLIQADSAQGKTEYLNSIATAIELCHLPREVQYGVLTDKPEEWKQRPTSHHNIGIFPIRERIAFDFILSLNTWAHSNHSDQSVILLWDDLETVNQLDTEIADNFRWLLLRGPAKKIWPIVTLNTSSPSGVVDWKGYFHTCINGWIQNPVHCIMRPNDSGAIKPGYVFRMNTGPEAVNIWMPRTQVSTLRNFPLLRNST